MAKYLTNTEDLTTIANAIRTKGGTSGQLTFPSGMAQAIADIPTGGTQVEEKDINFYDYDGTLVESWELSELQGKSSLPTNPDRTSEGLTAQGWNWTLEELKTQNTAMNVGQMYEPTDGALHLFIKLYDGYLSPYLNLGIKGTATIDWGDGTTSTVTGTKITTLKSTRHAYNTCGDYEIKVIPSSGTTLGLLEGYNGGFIVFELDGIGDSAYDIYYQNLTKIYVPSAVTHFGDGSFGGNETRSITLPTNMTTIPIFSFMGSRSLRFITIPRGVNTIGDGAFANCVNLITISFPNTITSIGDYAFCANNNNDGLNYSTKSIFLPNSITSLGTKAFYRFRGLSRVVLSSNITNLGTYAFYNCPLLTNISIPESVINIAINGISWMHFLESLEIPENVETIYVYYCSHLKTLKFKPLVPPVASSSSSLGYLPTTCKILVPSGTLAAYTSATNYPSPSEYTYEEY